MTVCTGRTVRTPDNRNNRNEGGDVEVVESETFLNEPERIQLLVESMLRERTRTVDCVGRGAVENV
jgi:hypothetical protein